MTRIHRNPFDLWHLLSLDAPTVAALWCWTLGRAAGLRLPWTAPLMLALGAWLLYVSDRLLDGFLTKNSVSLRERHHFHRRHRRAFFMAAALGCVALLSLVRTRLPLRALHEDLLLGCCALVYLMIVHVPLQRTHRFPKELAVGLVFAAATAVPAWARLPSHSATRIQMLPLILLFAALCWINCVAIEHWEAEISEAVCRSSSSTLWLGAHLSFACYTVALLALGAFAYGCRQPPARPAYLAGLAALIVSPLLFAGLHHARGRFSPLRLRVAADAVLLTPLLFFPVLR